MIPAARASAQGEEDGLPAGQDLRLARLFVVCQGYQDVGGCPQRLTPGQCPQAGRQTGKNLCFPLEAGEAVGVCRKRLGQDLERHLPVQLGVGGFPHLPHPAFTQLGGDVVMAESRTDV